MASGTRSVNFMSTSRLNHLGNRPNSGMWKIGRVVIYFHCQNGIGGDNIKTASSSASGSFITQLICLLPPQGVWK